MTHKIVPDHLAIKAFRDNGYKDTSFAVAELLDNSIQAGAGIVELLCVEKMNYSGQRSKSVINKIAVVDNGDGMSSKVLWDALQFGNGTRLESKKHTGIGRFGMGLPNSSVSQCKMLEVWSWQNGVENAVYSYLDVDRIMSEEQTDIPEPTKKEVPSFILDKCEHVGNSGTAVVWSKLDRCIWKTGKTIIRNSEFNIGRIYRHFLNNKNLEIKLSVYNEDNGDFNSREAVPTDPCYLMEKTSCPPPYDTQAMFQKYGEHPIPIRIGNEEYEVKVTYTYAKKEAREGDQAGDKEHGRHAKKNQGISLVRADRELGLITLFNNSDPRERWWGVEVSFPPALDEIFGVTNNKQDAMHFNSLMGFDISAAAKAEDMTVVEYRKHLEELEDPRCTLIEICSQVQDGIAQMRQLIKSQKSNTRTSNRRHSDSGAEKKATKVTEERISEGHTGTSDQDDSLSSSEKEKQITQTLKDSGMDETEAKAAAKYIVNENLKYIFSTHALNENSFFSIRPIAGKIHIVLNSNHPAYDNLIEVLDKGSDDDSSSDLPERLEKARQGMRLLLMAWARYEDEQMDGKLKRAAQQVRTDWGIIASDFLDQE